MTRALDWETLGQQVRAALHESTSWLTVYDLAARLGWSVVTTQRVLLAEIATGRVVRRYESRRPGATGRLAYEYALADGGGHAA